MSPEEDATRQERLPSAATTLVLAGALFAGVVALRFAVSGAGEAVGILFVLPIALLAIRFGPGGGLAGSLLALALTGLWVVASGAHLGVVGWVSRAVAFVLLGGLLGWFAQRLRAANAHQARAARVERLLRVTDAALSSMPLQEQLVDVLSHVCEALPADAAALLLADSPTDALVLQATHGLSRPAAEMAKLSPGLGLAAQVTEQRHPIVITGAEVSQLRVTALREMGTVAGAPLFGDSRVTGVLEVGRRGTGQFDDGDLALLQFAAERTALALDHARVFERERHIAQTLQQGLLPERLPDIPGVTLQARFLPAGDGHEVGGDFYDVVALGGARWMLVVGDVCGKGPEAATLTAMVRYTLRAEAMHEPRPGELLGLLNDAILTQRAGLLSCTAVCAVLDLSRPQRVVTIASGGHPMPLIINGNGSAAQQIARAGPLIGVWADAEFPERRHPLMPGDTLVAYTDGLLEAHAPDRVLTPLELADAAKGHPVRPLETFVRALEDAALGSSTVPVRDDIAILALAIESPPPPETPERATTAPAPGAATGPVADARPRHTGPGRSGEPGRRRGS